MADFSESNSIMQDLRAQLQQSQVRIPTGASSRMLPLAHTNGSTPPSPLDTENTPSTQRESSALLPEPVVPVVIYPDISGRKRRGAPGEADAIVRRLARRTNLSQSIQDSLALYSAAPLLEREIMAHCAVLQLHERLDLIQPVDAPFELKSGSELKTQLEKYKTVVMMSPHTPGYLSDPPRLVIEILSRHPGWGLTAAVMDSPPKLAVIATYARSRCTDFRKEVKKHIKLSLGKPSACETEEKREKAQNIEVLVKKCVGSAGTNSGHIIITAEICARFAYLRFMYMKTEGRQLWKAVDKGLETIREECPDSTPAGKEAQSKFFASILEKDLALYGHPKSPRVLRTFIESDIQKEVLTASLAAPTVDIGSDADDVQGDGIEEVGRTEDEDE